MQFLNFILVAATTVFSVQACKCVDGNDVENDGTTQLCCSRLAGSFTNNDCAAGSISNSLSNFESCCNENGLQSDCGCPTC